MCILCLSEPLFLASEGLSAVTLYRYYQLNDFPFILDRELALLLPSHCAIVPYTE